MKKNNIKRTSILLSTMIVSSIIAGTAHTQELPVPQEPTGVPSSSFPSNSEAPLMTSPPEGNNQTYLTPSGTRVSTFSRLKITPYVEAAATVSDNITLAPDGQEETGIGTTIGAGVDVDYKQRRFDAIGGVGARGTWRSEGEDDVIINPYANIAAQAELVRDRLYLDGSAAYTKFYTGTDTTSFNGLASGDSDNGIGQYLISPSLRQPLGKFATSELRLTHSQILSPNSGIGNSMTNEARATIASRNLGRFGLQAQGLYSDTQTDNDFVDGELTRTTGLLTGSYAATQRLTLLARGGWDEIDSPAFTEDYSGAAAGAGFQYRPTPRASLYALAGTRFNEFNLEADARYQINDNLTAGASYLQDVVPANRNIFRTVALAGEFNPILEDEALSTPEKLRQISDISGLDLIGVSADGNTGFGFVQNSTYISRMGSAWLAGRSDKVEGYLAGTTEYAEFDKTNDVTTINGIGSISREFTPKWRGTAQALYNSLISDNNLYDYDTAGGRLIASYNVTENAALALTLAHTQRIADSSLNEYSENAATLSFRAEF